MFKKTRSERGSILLLTYILVVVFLVYSAAIMDRSVWDRKLFDIKDQRAEAFWLTETSVDGALRQLSADYDNLSSSGVVSYGPGQYEYAIGSSVYASGRTITAYGYVPTKASSIATRGVEAVTKRSIPPDFYGNAIYSAGNIDLNGSSYAINGNVVYATTITSPSNITGSATNNPAVSPLARFDFAIMRDIAIAQGNYYDGARLSDVAKNRDSYPADFWFVPPTDPSDPTTGVPNVVYIEGNMVLNGNIGTPGGFFLVVGDVLTDPDNTADTTINGNGTVSGCIYTTGEFKINGGGGNLNVDGGVWAGSEARLNGNATVSYNAEYMTSIQNLVQVNSAGGAVQLLSWRELL